MYNQQLNRHFYKEQKIIEYVFGLQYKTTKQLSLQLKMEIFKKWCPAPIRNHIEDNYSLEFSPQLEEITYISIKTV